MKPQNPATTVPSTAAPVTAPPVTAPSVTPGPVTATAATRLRKADVCAELGISQRTLDNLVLRNEFPPGVRIGRWSYWSCKAIDNFRERSFAMQERWTPMQSTTSRRR